MCVRVFFFKQKKQTPKEGAKDSRSCHFCGQEWPRDLLSFAKEASLLSRAASAPGVLRPSRRDLNPTSLKDRARRIWVPGLYRARPGLERVLSLSLTALEASRCSHRKSRSQRRINFPVLVKSGPRCAEGSCALFRSVLNFPSEEPAPPPLPWAWLGF